MKYNIYRKNGQIHRESLSLDQFLSFCEKNDMKLFDVKESQNGKEKVVLKQTEDEYRKSLTLAQLNDLSTGIKVIGKNSEGYYLKRIKEDREINVSIPEKTDLIKITVKKGTKLSTILADYFAGGICVREFDLNAKITCRNE